MHALIGALVYLLYLILKFVKHAETETAEINVTVLEQENKEN